MMIQAIKDLIWDCIKGKDVALFMIFSADGEVLYHRGRAVMGRTIAEGKGFCRSYCLEALKKRKKVAGEDCLVNLNGNGLSESAVLLQIKQLIVFPVSEELFFYLDSGGKEPFLIEEIVELRILGKVFFRLIKEIERNEKSGHISGCSEAADRIRLLVRKYAVAEEPVLLLGETGTGKNRVAKLIHGYSGRKGNFVLVHTPGVAKELFESQLFGHRKGSFTGAIADTTGYVEQAVGGTLFLDEIAELSPEVQAKLLRLLDDKTYIRLGEAVERRVDVRIVAATNKDLKILLGQKLFREDLYFRLNVLPITIPPLRERREDIPELLADFRGLLRGKKLGKDAVRILVNYAWPGNVRELRSLLTRAGINHDNPEIGPEIAEFFEKDFPLLATVYGNDKLDRIWQELKDGKTFWDVVKKPYLNRDLNRYEVQTILSRGLNECGRKYKNVVSFFNLEDREYHRFMSFLNENDLNENS